MALIGIMILCKWLRLQHIVVYYGIENEESNGEVVHTAHIKIEQNASMIIFHAGERGAIDSTLVIG